MNIIDIHVMPTISNECAIDIVKKIASALDKT